MRERRLGVGRRLGERAAGRSGRVSAAQAATLQQRFGFNGTLAFNAGVMLVELTRWCSLGLFQRMIDGKIEGRIVLDMMS